MQGQRHFTHYACRERALIHFEDALGNTSEVFGPFDHIVLVEHGYRRTCVNDLGNPELATELSSL